MSIDAFEIDELIGRLDPAEGRDDYAEFFRTDTLSLTVVLWPAGSIDDQTPHAEDEVYFIHSGRATLRVGDEEREVGPGTIAFVGAGVEHNFHSIEEDLQVLVFWSPPWHANE
jgi:mannose-6-phosphate isomerase-like protein (cupin superfamily)